MTIVITRENALQELDKIVKKQGGDYIYQQHDTGSAACLYAWRGKPDCIIGRLLRALGASIWALEECDGIGGIVMLAEKGIVDVEDSVLLDALRDLQDDQDAGLPWGEGFARFEDALASTLV